MDVLTATNHSRDRVGQRYVYPVLSRRSGGLSVGINLNPNNACNWRCMYCQVPNLVRGSSPPIDCEQLERELIHLLGEILSGAFYKRHSLPDDRRAIRDIALSGNGEPTSCQAFESVLDIVGRVCTQLTLPDTLKKIIITNGSLVSRPVVQRGLARWSALGGEIWFKLDSATTEGVRRINQAHRSLAKTLHHLEICTHRCPTWIQTCFFAWDGQPPDEREQQAYLDALRTIRQWDRSVKGVLLYGLARPSMQPEALRLSALPLAWLAAMGEQIQSIGLQVQIHV